MTQFSKKEVKRVSETQNENPNTFTLAPQRIACWRVASKLKPDSSWLLREAERD